VVPRAITGLGIVSCAGTGREAFVEAMRRPTLLAKRPRGALESFDASKYQDVAAAEVPGFDPTKYLGDKGLRTLDRLTKLLIVAGRLAMHDAGFKKDGQFVTGQPERVGIICSNAYGSLEAITELDRVAMLEDARYINPAKFPNTVANSASGYVSIWEDLRALNVAVSDGNCGALDAVACADIHLETGRADALLVGGGEALSEPLYVAFHKLGVLDSGAMLGEGAALMSLERADFAKERGATVLGWVTGFGTAFMPPKNEATLIHASTEAVERAVAQAIADAGVAPKDIDVVASGISGLRAFDDAELAALVRTLGPEVCVAAPKHHLGETLGAAGAMGMSAALAWLAGATPSSIVVGRAPKSVRTVLVTSMGFYGNATAVVLRASA
jgi:3-oxoacyl-(acyl-carrier-protein) synthase